MIQFETTKATILFVEVPEDAKTLTVDGITHLIEKGLFNEDVKRKPHTPWTLLTLLKDAREEHHKMISDEPDALHSLANSLGVKGNCAVLVKGCR